jgi:glycosyltransferase involved in cell wall biosynthesis
MIVRILAGREEFGVLSLLDEDTHRPAAASAFCTTCGGGKWKFAVAAMRLALKGNKPELVVGHVGLLRVAWALRRMNLTRGYAIVLHGIEAWRRQGWLTRVAAREASCVVATTVYTAREFCFLNDVDAEHCVVIPLASDISRRTTGEIACPATELKLLAVSRLSEADRYKGFDTLLRAVRMGLDRGLALTLEVIGDGNDAERLRSLADSLDIQDSVLFRGSVRDDDLERAYRESHVFVLPSKKEGFGIVFMEAMAAGLPCIGGNHGGTPEVIEHGVSGYLIEYGDAEQLAFYLQAMAESRELYDSLSRGARLRAEALGFESMARSWGRVADRLNGSDSAFEAGRELSRLIDTK